MGIGSTPLGLWGGDTAIYRSIIGLSALALPVIAAVNWYTRGTLSWPQLAIAGGILGCALACYFVARSGLREIAAALLIGTLWVSTTIYAFKSGYGMHSAVVFIYLPCLLYTGLFFGLFAAGAELGLTVATLGLMYYAEEQGQLPGAAGFVMHGTNFNFFLGVVLTSIGTLVAGAVYHRRLEREAARVLEAAEERRVAMERAQHSQAQLEIAHAQLQSLHKELSDRGAVRETLMANVRRDLDLLHDVVSREIPSAVRVIRANLVAPGERAATDLQGCLDRIDAVLGTLDSLGPRRREALWLESLDVSMLAREALEKLAAASKLGAGVRVDIEPGLRAHGDRQLVTNLLWHLLGRAIGSCRGEPDAHVRLATGTMHGRAVFHVTDNGPGMDAARRELLFRPFDQAFGRRREDSVDVAALSARHIVEQHGGELGVESAPGHGTTFYFWLPTPAS